MTDQLVSLLERRDALQQQVQRVMGRLEQAKRELEDAEADCRKKGIEPEQIDQVIDKLQKKLDKEVAELASALEQAERQMVPFLEGGVQ